MKKIFLIFGFILVFTAVFLPAQTANNPALKPLLNHFAARNFTTEEVTRAELDLIIEAGIRAPSASNRQPWFFTVVQNQNLARRIFPQSTQGNVLIIVSAVADTKTNASIIMDCSMAIQSMYLAAQALGLGSRIYISSVDTINSNHKSELSMPQNQNAVALIRIGRLPPNAADTISSASQRKDTRGIVTYK